MCVCSALRQLLLLLLFFFFFHPVLLERRQLLECSKESGGWLLLLLSSSRGGAHTQFYFSPFSLSAGRDGGGGGRACKNRILHQQSSSPPSPSPSTPLRVFRGIDVPQLLLYKFIHPPLSTLFFLPISPALLHPPRIKPYHPPTTANEIKREKVAGVHRPSDILACYFYHNITLFIPSFSLFPFLCVPGSFFFLPKTGTLRGATRVCQQHATFIQQRQQRLALHVHTHKAHYTISLFSVSSPLCHGSIGSESAANSTVFPSTRLCNCASITKTGDSTARWETKKQQISAPYFFFQREK